MCLCTHPWVLILAEGKDEELEKWLKAQGHMDVVPVKSGAKTLSTEAVLYLENVVNEHIFADSCSMLKIKPSLLYKVRFWHYRRSALVKRMY